MNDYTISMLALQHVDDLRRDASKRRLGRITRKHRKERGVRGRYGFSVLRLQEK